MSRPSDVSKALRQIAAKIDRSSKPDKVLVAREIKRVLASLSSDWRSSPPSGWDPSAPMAMAMTELGVAFDYEKLPDGSFKIWGWDADESPFEGVVSPDGKASFSEGGLDGHHVTDYIVPHMKAGL